MIEQKLNTKRTIFVGFAFFLITAFWQAYDKIVPLMLTNRFGMNQTASGLIMALDNIFALFLLPLFGSLSDKTKTKYGKRTPYIVIGTVCAIVAFIILSIIDAYQLSIVNGQSIPELYANLPATMSPEDKVAWLIETTWPITQSNIGILVGFICALLASLLAMATFRSPAVALMPDVTVKPLRSKGNAIINLMGTAGGILVLGIGMIIKTSTHSSYVPYTIAVCVVMAIGLALFMFLVKEPKWNEEMLIAQAEIDKVCPPDEAEVVGEKKKLSKSQLTSLILILSSVALWYMGYNAITTKYSVLCDHILHMSYDFTLIIAQAAAIISYIPVGIVASKLGRKKTILIGVALLTLAFGSGAILTEIVTMPKYAENGAPLFVEILMFVVFALAGIGWATINVNSFPMAVELASGSDIGKYTGYYYTASMLAQVITPIFSGFLMDTIGYDILFIYATIFAGLAFVTMMFVRHGNAQELNGKTAKELIQESLSSD